MDLRYVPRDGDTSQWRHRGRPPTPVPPYIMDLLRQTEHDESYAEIDVRNESNAEVRDLIRTLRRGCIELGGRLKKQHAGTLIRFYLDRREA